MRTLAIVLLLTTTALAEEPTEEQKTWALKRAYELNGNSMTGWGSIDLTDEFRERYLVAPKNQVQTEKIIPDKPEHRRMK